MRSSLNYTIISVILLAGFFAQAYGDNLVCYVCDDCDKVGPRTPVVACNEHYFHEHHATVAPIAETTNSETLKTTTTSMLADSTATTTVAQAESSTQSTSTTTTTAAAAPSTATPSTTAATTATTTTTTATATTPISATTSDASQQTSSTTESFPTPKTVGPLELSTAVPTPPEVDADVSKFESEERNSTTDNASKEAVTETVLVDAAGNATTEAALGGANKTYTASSIFRARQRRAVAAEKYSYHCYSIQKQANNSVFTERGCARVTELEGVCSKLRAPHNQTINECKPCSLPKCNGASALQVSLGTLIMAAVVMLLQRN